MSRRLVVVLLLACTPVLLLGACSSDDDSTDGGSEQGDDGGGDSEAQPASGGGEDFCAVVEDNVDTATGEDLLAAVPAIEAMADAAPLALQEAFEENLAALEPVAAADDTESATSIFAEEVAAEPAFTDSFTEIADGIDEECGIDVSSSGSD